MGPVLYGGSDRGQGSSHTPPVQLQTVTAAPVLGPVKVVACTVADGAGLGWGCQQRVGGGRQQEQEQAGDEQVGPDAAEDDRDDHDRFSGSEMGAAQDTQTADNAVLMHGQCLGYGYGRW